MLLVDTHCHIDMHQYDEDRDLVWQRAEQVEVTRVINPAIDLESSRRIVQLTEQYTGLYAAVGVHPNDIGDFDAETIAELEQLTVHPKVVAIGEIGIDHYWKKFPRQAQIKVFESQLDLAARLGLPVIIHNREASDDVITVLEAWAANLPASLRDRPGVMHSFSGSVEIAERALAINFYLGFTGPITFKKSDEMRAVAALAPPDRVLVETDGPYLTPEPYRGKRNEPAYIPYIVERLALVKQLSVEAIAQATTENATKLFNLPQ